MLKNECKVIDFVYTLDSRIEEREKDKMKGYNDLKRELKKIWDMPVKVVITTAQIHSTKPELRFSVGSNPARGVSEICDGEDL